MSNNKIDCYFKKRCSQDSTSSPVLETSSTVISEASKLSDDQTSIPESSPTKVRKLDQDSNCLNIERDPGLQVGFLRNLVNLNLSHNRLSGIIPDSLSRCMSLEWVHLQSNYLTDEIPDGLRVLRGLQGLDLSHNNLSGLIPRFLCQMPLVILNLSFNRLQGEVPSLGLFRNESAISLEGNIDLCGGIPHLNLPPCPSKNTKTKHFSTLWKILIPVVGVGAIFLALCFHVVIYRRCISQKTQSSMPRFGTEFLRLSYADLLKVTGRFSEVNLIGSGKFGSVYKGILDDGKTILAVKVLKLDVKGASKSFSAECNALRGIRHRNLVKY
ncbi:hypothetical protein BUALT_Bualt08G0086500 [Buddleja alternifolia]|uniref:Protein kinase domain-containing protein n=1 Tax=Buddleja alternifolia TaxID=168488 RepID=A0AAV6XCU3_9LAMI|nr:hypothetical protein BUALT_Bualt08G0086500 [Buddleja alternifolia]